MLFLFLIDLNHVKHVVCIIVSCSMIHHPKPYRWPNNDTLGEQAWHSWSTVVILSCYMQTKMLLWISYSKRFAMVDFEILGGFIIAILPWLLPCAYMTVMMFKSPTALLFVQHIPVNNREEIIAPHGCPLSWRIHWRRCNSINKSPVMQKAFPFHVIGQQGCRDACQISVRYDIYNIQSHKFEISRDRPRGVLVLVGIGPGGAYSGKKQLQKIMMTSSNGNIFRVIGHLYGEFTGPRWIPRTKASDAGLRCFLWSASE